MKEIAADSVRMCSQEERQQLRAKLEESKHQLQGNEHMIRWLNSQVHF